MIESIRIWLQLIETVLDWQLVMDWESSGSIIKWWSLGAGNFLFITPRHTHTLVSFSTGDMFRFFRLFWRGEEIIFCKKEKIARVWRLWNANFCKLEILVGSKQVQLWGIDVCELTWSNWIPLDLQRNENVFSYHKIGCIALRSFLPQSLARMMHW